MLKTIKAPISPKKPPSAPMRGFGTSAISVGGPEGEKAIDPPRNAYKPPEKETKRPTSIPASTPEIK